MTKAIPAKWQQYATLGDRVKAISLINQAVADYGTINDDGVAGAVFTILHELSQSTGAEVEELFELWNTEIRKVS